MTFECSVFKHPTTSTSLASPSSLSHIFPTVHPGLASYLPSGCRLSTTIPSFIVCLRRAPRGLWGQCTLPPTEGTPGASYRSGESSSCKIKSSALPRFFFFHSLLGREAPRVQWSMSSQCLKAPKPGDSQTSTKRTNASKRDASIFIHLYVLPGFLPLGAVSMAGMTLVVGLGVLEDETVGPLQPVGALLHAVGSIFEVEAFYTLVRALRGEEEQGGGR